MARYIDADKLIEHIKDLPTWFKEDGWWHSTKYPNGHFDCDDVINSIDNAPTADVEEVKQGEWKINCDGYYPYCSICGTEPEGRVLSKHCPECGAKMDGKDDSNEE